MKILRDNAFINTEMVTTKMAVMSGHIYIYIYLYINPSPATDHGTSGAKSSPHVCPELSLLCGASERTG